MLKEKFTTPRGNGHYCEYARIDKRTARRLYAAGCVITLAAVNMRWSSGCECGGLETAVDFEKLCNAYAYYNCNAETGRYIKYAVQIETMFSDDGTRHAFPVRHGGYVFDTDLA